jgi:hypothetical protein
VPAGTRFCEPSAARVLEGRLLRATVEILRLPLADAKRLVHESQAWADRRESDDRFHEVLEAQFRTEAAADRACPGEPQPTESDHSSW